MVSPCKVPPVSSLPTRAFRAAGQFIKENPDELLRAARGVTSFRFGVPLAALRWIAEELRGKGAPEDVVIEARNAGLYVEASLNLMKTPLRATTTLVIQRISVRPHALLVDLRVSGLKLRVLDPSAGTPIAALIQSGALDTSRPGDLLSFIPTKPAFIVEAKGDLFTIDLMKLPALGREKARKIIGGIAPFLGVHSVATADDHLDIRFDPFPDGASAALRTVRSWF